MKKSQKSKIVLCSILGLAAISIGSVGFATWLVGINKTTETLTVQAVVDNSQNDSIYLDVVTTQDKFVIAESEAHPKSTGEIVGTQANSGKGAITFDDLEDFSDDLKDDKECVYTKQCLDRELQQYCGASFEPYEKRYFEED